MNNCQSQNETTAFIEDALPTVSVNNLDTFDDVNVVFEITIDANDAENDLTQAAWQSEQLLSDFDVTVESNKVLLIYGIELMIEMCM